MKHFSDQNYYEILEVSYKATWSEIQKTYELAKKTYGPDSIAAYSLFHPEDRESIVKKIEEAYHTLIDPEKRRRYDEELAKVVQEVLNPVPVDPAESSPTFLFDSLSPSGEISGKVLREIREKRGISLQEIADRTRISITYLQFIEEDHFKNFPAEVYFRSYLNQYVKILHWDAKRIIEGYMKAYQRWREEKGKEE